MEGREGGRKERKENVNLHAAQQLREAPALNSGRAIKITLINVEGFQPNRPIS